MIASVIIPTYKDWDRLQKCLDSLCKQTIDINTFEIIVVNNDSNEQAPQSLKLPQNCVLIEESKPGSYAARNKALKQAKGTYICFTDSDCICEKDWIKNSIELLEENSEISRIAGAVKIFFEKGVTEWSAFCYERIFAFNQKENAAKKSSVTANMITYRSTFKETGLFDENLKSGGDILWGRNAEKLGFSIMYGENCIVKHPSRNMSTLLLKEKRVVGGWFDQAKKKRKDLFKLLLKVSKPPVFAILKVIKSEELSFKEKVSALSVLIILRFAGFLEFLLLFLGKKSGRE